MIFPQEIPLTGLGPEIPIPVVYEEAEPEPLSLRAYAAIQLRVPDSGIDWLDRMIERSRKLDRRAATCR
ncbi:MAG: hypothetical protein IT165_22310 [Bryobacterales bacterium]|nr:hypothetical protein [Bryobacterales bacterium]